MADTMIPNIKRNNILEEMIKREDIINGISVIDYIKNYYDVESKNYISNKREYHKIVKEEINNNLFDEIKQLNKADQIDILRNIYLYSYLLDDCKIRLN